MIIYRRIKVKIIVTGEFKSLLVKEIQERLKHLEAEITFLEQRARKAATEMAIKASPQAQSVLEQLEREKKKREEARAGLNEQIKIASNLEEGAEVVHGEVESPVEIKIGDNWDALFQQEVVVKDGIIVDIR